MYKRTGRTSFLVLSQQIAAALLMTGAAQATDVGAQFVHYANTLGSISEIHHPLTDGNPDAIVRGTQNYNPPGGVSGVYNDHQIGVAYTGADWSIFNQDGAAMPDGASFNVTVAAPIIFNDGFESGDTTAGSAVVP